ncbi:MAG: endopeptidase La [Desulfobacteraceae bacterium]|nr:MAG: endopeptidase La [Desulfobacteraceae bacterium]
MNEKNIIIPDILPVLPMRDAVIFPKMVVPLMIKNEEYSRLIDDALQKDNLIVVALVKNIERDQASQFDIYKTATVGQVIKLSKGEEGTLLVLQGLSRVEITDIISKEPYLSAKVKKLEDMEVKGIEIDALNANLLELFKQILELSPHMPRELVQLSQSIDVPGSLADMIASTVNIDRQKKQKILEALDIRERLAQLVLFLNEEIELLHVGKKIQDEVKKGIDKSQKEFYLKEHLKAIQKELGMDKEVASEINELKDAVEKKALPDHVRKSADKELQRISNMNPSSSEYTVSRTYLDWILDLPWLEGTKDRIDIKYAEKILEKYHYNLDKVKRRILEYLAVRKLNPEHKGPILCLVGPPGTGKTSLGRSIAEAIGRKFIRISLGGVRDEAEIRGHRRTYVGALPGRIVQGIRRAGSNNPVFMLDEIDKVGTDFRGDPSSALLEVLDPEQNFSFSDHYLELEFDLSGVMFIATANQLEPVPAPLRDRMEVLELSGYTEDDKIAIARRFLVPRQTREHGLKNTSISFRKTAIKKVIREYTREAGLRNLEREIGAICRGVARKVAEGELVRVSITEKTVGEYLGKPKFTVDLAERTSVPGIATGLAWTPAGGDILFIEATMMPGQKSLSLTGQLGDVMKESAQTALSYLRSNAASLHIPVDFFKEHDIHIHVPAGAIPKDGPSAGVTMLTALASLVSSRPVKSGLAMTGEVTLRGLVLPVGGIKEKVLAASRSGITQLILPKGNEKDLDEIPDEVRKKIIIHFVSKMEEVLSAALVPPAGKTGGPDR